MVYDLIAKIWPESDSVYDLTAIDKRRQRAFKITGLTWIVERSFAWLGRNRRLSKDYEYSVQTSETLIDIAEHDLFSTVSHRLETFQTSSKRLNKRGLGHETVLFVGAVDPGDVGSVPGEVHLTDWSYLKASSIRRKKYGRGLSNRL